MQHVRYGAVVPFQSDKGTVFEVRLESPDVPDVGAAESVDGLVIVAHHEQVVSVSEDIFYQSVLRGVDILVFIHQDFIPKGLEIFPCLIVGFQQVDSQVD